MPSKHYNLPPMTTLLAFEAAARHRSFKNAAAELNVSPGAVSHQIRALENELAAVLFERRHRGVELTHSGELLFTACRDCFTNVSAAVAQVRAMGENKAVTIGATSAVSSLWLTPRLTAFWKEHGDIRVNQHISDSPDPLGAVVDLQIRYGIPEQKSATDYPLFVDYLMPLCSPAFAECHSDTSLEALAAMPLIHLDAFDTNWTTWRRWFDELGYSGTIGAGQSVNNYAIALQFARDDIGLVLGWQQLVQPLLKSGFLVPLGSQVLRAPAAFFIAAPPNELLMENTRILRDWLLDSV